MRKRMSPGKLARPAIDPSDTDGAGALRYGLGQMFVFVSSRFGRENQSADLQTEDELLAFLVARAEFDGV